MRILSCLLLTLALPAVAAAQSGPDPTDVRLAKLLVESRADASRIRGLSFLSEIPVKRITPEDFRELLVRDMGRLLGEGDRLTHMETVLQRLGILPADQGVMDVVDRFFPRTVAANYNPYLKRISFLRGFRSKSIMVHELTHALQDQHFNLTLHVESGETTFDRLLALGALAEGDAEDVQRMFDTGGMLALTPLATIRSIGESETEKYLARMKDFPRGIARPFIFQYLSGLLFVETIKRERDGYPGVDRVWLDPPGSTEQVLHPERYLERDHPTRIEAPRPPDGWRVLLSNVFGELGVRIVLEAHGDPSFETAAQGWDGDRMLLLDTGPRADGGDGRILVWYTTWDTEEDAREFAAAAKRMLVKRRPDASLKEIPGRGVTLQLETDRAQVVVIEGKDVLFIDGIPRANLTANLAALLTARKVELRRIVSGFGEDR